jgi:hypothetical protein
VREHYASVTITWDQAMAEYDNRELPKWEGECRAALPNYDELPADCAQARSTVTPITSTTKKRRTRLSSSRGVFDKKLMNPTFSDFGRNDKRERVFTSKPKPWHI